MERADVEDVVLITLVQNHPILYDQTHMLYKRTDKKSVIWSQIAASLAIPGKLIDSD